jgi:glyoxylate carboligase
MTKTVCDFLLERLGTWGVTRLFGYPGDDINGIVTALGRLKGSGAAGSPIEFIQTSHEEEAAFMASGHAKLRGEVGDRQVRSWEKARVNALEIHQFGSAGAQNPILRLNCRSDMGPCPNGSGWRGDDYSVAPERR